MFDPAYDIEGDEDIESVKEYLKESDSNDNIEFKTKYKNGITIKDEDIRESFIFEIKVPNYLELINKNEINQ